MHQAGGVRRRQRRRPPATATVTTSPGVERAPAPQQRRQRAAGRVVEHQHVADRPPAAARRTGEPSRRAAPRPRRRSGRRRLRAGPRAQPLERHGSPVATLARRATPPPLAPEPEQRARPRSPGPRTALTRPAAAEQARRRSRSRRPQASAGPTPRVTRVADVVVVGAGLAGLACARRALRGRASTSRCTRPRDAVGGRVRTDVVDGMLLDRGFQVHNTGYPEAQRVLDHAALDLRPLRRRRAGALRRPAAPGRRPAAGAGLGAVDACAAPIGSLQDKALIGVLRRPRRAAVPAGPAARRARRRTTYAGPARPRAVRHRDRPVLPAVPVRGLPRGRARDLQPVLRPGLALVRPRHASACRRPAWARSPRSSPPAARRRRAPRRARSRDVAAGRSTARRCGRSSSPPTRRRRPAAARPRRARDATASPRTTTWPPSRRCASRAIVLDGERSGPVANTVVLTNAAPSLRPRPAPGLELRRQRRRLRAGRARRTWPGSTASTPAAGSTSRGLRRPGGAAGQAPPMGRFRGRSGSSDGLYVCGDHRDSASIQGALVSGRRAADARARGAGVTSHVLAFGGGGMLRDERWRLPTRPAPGARAVACPARRRRASAASSPPSGDDPAHVADWYAAFAGRPERGQPPRAAAHAQRRRPARAPARPGRWSGSAAAGWRAAGAVAAARARRGLARGARGRRRARRGQRRVAVLAQRRHHRLVRPAPAPLDRRPAPGRRAPPARTTTARASAGRSTGGSSRRARSSPV